MNEPTTQRTGSYLTPRIEHALVADAMRHGVLSCPADASLRAAARTMALHHIHTVVVAADDGQAEIVSDAVLVRALLAPDAAGRTLGDIAERPLTLSSDQDLGAALMAMSEAGVDHAIVLDAHNGRPTGMLSTLDALGVFAWGEA